MIKQILILIIITFFSSSLFGQELDISLSKVDRDTFPLHFRFNSSLVEREYLSNSSTLERLGVIFLDSSYLKKTDLITITTTASPEGIFEHNVQLAYERSMAIRRYLTWHYPELKKIDLSIHSEVHKWSELIPYVEKDSSMQNKNRVIEILQNKDKVSRATIEWRLKKIGNGTTWKYIARNYFRYLRSGSATINFYFSCDAISKTLNPIIGIPDITNLQNVDTLTRPIESGPTRGVFTSKPLFALKTNLLFDAMSLVNVELEIPINKRFSIAGEWIFPWWTFDNGKADSKRHRIQMLNASLEGRYWFGNRNIRPVMTGWFAGVYIGGGLYDFEYNAKGYQGEFFIMGGVSGGYAHTINRKGNLRMEYSLGLGYMETDYRYYEAHFANTNVWHPLYNKGGRYSWIGPTKVKVSLVWMLNKKGGRR